MNIVHALVKPTEVSRAFLEVPESPHGIVNNFKRQLISKPCVFLSHGRRKVSHRLPGATALYPVKSLRGGLSVPLTG